MTLSTYYSNAVRMRVACIARTTSPIQVFAVQVCSNSDLIKTHPKMLRQTLPFLYRFGLKRTVPSLVVISRTRGARIG